MRTIDIPGGQAVLRDQPDELRVRQSRLIQTTALAAGALFGKLKEVLPTNGQPVDVQALAASMPDMTRTEAATLLEVQDAMLVALLVSWTLPDPLPTMDTVQDMEADVYQTLTAAVTKANLGAMFTKAIDFSSPVDKAGPTTLPSLSDGPSKDEPSTLTPPSPTDGESTATENFTPA